MNWEMTSTNWEMTYDLVLTMVKLDRALAESMAWLTGFPERQKQALFERLLVEDAAARRMRMRQRLNKVILKVLPL